jgi:hypothetical protein
MLILFSNDESDLTSMRTLNFKMLPQDVGSLSYTDLWAFPLFLDLKVVSRIFAFAPA